MRRLILFAKEPAAGRAKTRLAAGVGAVAAARLYGAFLADLAAALRAPDEWEAVVAHAEPAPGPRLRETFSRGWRLEPQVEGSLGDRLAGAFARAFSDGCEAAVLAGSDAPTLTSANVRAAFEVLGAAHAVFAPAPDGGFSLVGLTKTVAPDRLFARVRWSTADALADTRAAAERLGLSTALLPPVPDVDRASDLPALREALDRAPALAPSTRRALREAPAR